MKKITVDGHCDALLKDYYQEICHRDVAPHQVTKQLLQKGAINLQVFAIFVPPPLERFALEAAVDMIGLLGEMIAEDPDYLLVLGEAQLDQLKESDRIGVLIGLEGAEPLGNNLRRLDIFFQLGVRLITLTWSRRNFFADGSYWNPEEETNYGLTSLGAKLVEAMNHQGVIIDVSHLNERAFYEVLDLTTLPLVASHSCVKALCNSPRNLTDDQLKKLAQNRGVMGINFYPAFLSESKEASLDDVIRHIDYVCHFTGSADHVGLGSDFDGIDSTPKGLEDASKMRTIAEALEKKGYSEGDIHKIMGENFERVFRENWRGTR